MAGIERAAKILAATSHTNPAINRPITRPAAGFVCEVPWEHDRGCVPAGHRTKRIRYLEEKVAAADLVLTDDQLGRLAAAAPADAVAGERCPEHSMRAIGRKRQGWALK